MSLRDKYKYQFTNGGLNVSASFSRGQWPNVEQVSVTLPFQIPQAVKDELAVMLDAKLAEAGIKE